MIRDIDSDLVRGNVDTIILKSLSTGEKYGVEIAAFIEQSCNSQYVIKQPTLYGSLKRLEKQGLINSYWKGSGFGGRRHYYNLTEQGALSLKKLQEDWIYSRTVIDHLISNQTIDLNLFEKKPSQLVDKTESAENNLVQEEVSTQQEATPQQNLSAPQATEQQLTGNISAPQAAANSSYSSYIKNVNSVQDNKFLKYNQSYDALAEQVENTSTQTEAELFAANYINGTGGQNNYGIEENAEDLLNYQNILGETYYQNAEQENTEQAPYAQEKTERFVHQSVDQSFSSQEQVAPTQIDENTSYITESIAPPTYNNYQTNFKDYLVDENTNYATQEVSQKIQPITAHTPEVKQANTKNSVTSNKYMFSSQTLGTYVNYNKLKFFQSIFVSLFMIALCLISYYAVKSVQAISNEGTAITAVCIALSSWFVVYRGILYFLNPHAKKELHINWAATFFSKLLAIILTVILVLCLNIFMDLTLANYTEYLDTLVLPIVLTVSYLFSTLVLYILYKTKKFLA